MSNFVDRRRVRTICDAYLKGFDQYGRGLKSPYKTGSDADIAYAIGVYDAKQAPATNALVPQLSAHETVVSNHAAFNGDIPMPKLDRQESPRIVQVGISHVCILATIEPKP